MGGREYSISATGRGFKQMRVVLKAFLKLCPLVLLVQLVRVQVVLRVVVAVLGVVDVNVLKRALLCKCIQLLLVLARLEASRLLQATRLQGLGGVLLRELLLVLLLALGRVSHTAPGLEGLLGGQ